MYKLLTLTLAIGCSACAGAGHTRPKTTVYTNPSDGPAMGVGIEGQDIRTMTDRMARDILSAPQVAGRTQAPYVIVDDEYFVNEGSTPINKRLITERLMVELNRAASGRLHFVERQSEDMVLAERERKRAGETGAGSLEQTERIAGADFRLTGRIMTQDAVNVNSGMNSRYHEIVFKLVDLESGMAVWTNMYEMRKDSTSDVVYR